MGAERKVYRSPSKVSCCGESRERTLCWSHRSGVLKAGGWDPHLHWMEVVEQLVGLGSRAWKYASSFQGE